MEGELTVPNQVQKEKVKFCRRQSLRQKKKQINNGKNKRLNEVF